LMAISSENTYPAQIAWLMIDIASGDIKGSDTLPRGKRPGRCVPWGSQGRRGAGGRASDKPVALARGQEH
jgi:hypothetical protein